MSIEVKQIVEKPPTWLIKNERFKEEFFVATESELRKLHSDIGQVLINIDRAKKSPNYMVVGDE